MNRLTTYSILRDVFSILFIFGSFVIIPFLCYVWSDWWLLFGITFWWSGMFAATEKYKLLVPFSLLLFYYWYEAGFDLHQYITFFSAAFLLGYLLILASYKYKKLHDQILCNNLINQSVSDYGNTYNVSKDLLSYVVLQINDFTKQNPDILITKDFIHDFCARSVSAYMINKARREEI